MTTKQYSVKVLDVTIKDESRFVSFFEKNQIFFKNHLLSLHGNITEDVKKYLEKNGVKYIINTELPRREATKNVAPPKEEIKEEKPIIKKEEQKPQENLKVIDKLVRSGQQLDIKGDLLLLNRVNSGGSIVIEGNLIITQIVEGDIRCNGNFMMLKASPKANIVFHDVEVDNAYLKERLNRVELKNNEIRITPVLKETSWV